MGAFGACGRRHSETPVAVGIDHCVANGFAIFCDDDSQTGTARAFQRGGCVVGQAVIGNGTHFSCDVVHCAQNTQIHSVGAEFEREGLGFALNTRGITSGDAERAITISQCIGGCQGPIALGVHDGGADDGVAVASNDGVASSCACASQGWGDIIGGVTRHKLTHVSAHVVADSERRLLWR